jgi:hypothetical protein
MGFLTRLLLAVVGFAFTFGGFGKADAQEARLAKDGTVVLARENHRPTTSATSLEQLRKSLRLLASADAQPPTKPTKDKTKSPTKPRGI